MKQSDASVRGKDQWEHGSISGPGKLAGVNAS